jgi:hypothetical protein
MGARVLITFEEFRMSLGIPADQARILIAAAGVEPIGNSLHDGNGGTTIYDKADIAKVPAWRYKHECLTFVEFCAELGVSVQTARIYLAGAGVKPVWKRGNALMYNKADVAKVKAWYDARYHNVDHARLTDFRDALGVGVQTARKYIACAGVEPLLKMGGAYVYRKADIARVQAWRDSRH